MYIVANGERLPSSVECSDVERVAGSGWDSSKGLLWLTKGLPHLAGHKTSQHVVILVPPPFLSSKQFTSLKLQAAAFLS